MMNRGLLYAFILSVLIPGRHYCQDISFLATLESDMSKNKGTMQFHIKEDRTAVVMRNKEVNGEIKILYDFDKKTQTTLMESGGQKMAMVAPLTSVESMGADSQVDFKISKGDETRMIQGYECTKYIIEDKESISEIWTTDEIKHTYQDLFKTMSTPGGKNGGKKNMIPEGAEISGFPLEITARAKKKGGNMKMIMSDISTEPIDEQIFSTDGYQIIDTGSMMR